jgi:hypothetical protein
MEMMTVMSGTLLILLAFSVGFFLGRGVHEVSCFPVEPAQPDEQKRLKYEADQQALADCLNYSIDVAYGGGKM